MGIFKLWRISVLTGLGMTSYFAGRYHEKLNREQINQLCSGPGIPQVFAAAPITSDTLSNITKGSDPEVIQAQQKGVTAYSRVSQIMKYGFPSLDNIRSLDDYVLSYDRRNRVPHWVFEHLTKEAVKFNAAVDRSTCEFTEDNSIHPFFRSQNLDYKGSGYDRGHLAAAGNHKGNQRHCEQTFLLSNMAPQVGVGFNRHSWNRLEKYVRKLTKTYANVYVCTGPLYLPRQESDGKSYIKYQVIGSSTVAVPTHFFKVVVMEGSDSSLQMEAYVMPNQVISNETPLQNFQVPPETIERASGLLLFDKIPRNSLKTINGKKIGWF